MSESATPLIGRQGQLFAEEPSFDPLLTGLQRTDLSRGAWIDHLPEWVRGHEAVLETLWATTRWEAHRRRMYERIVDVPRLFLLRPAGGGRSLAFDLGGGDLLVMGGTCQRTWEHGVPKVAHADLRISVQFRSAPTAPYPPSLDGSVEEGERLGAA